ncbi:hypothetical protein [Sporomusa aerivorans]|uniref:hypothetical protein n=1 Tax=Sporomusa aerivorans TaxID=204936 RepID=UPI00352B4357
MQVTLTRADQSGVFALPEGKTTADIQNVLLDGMPTEIVFVKNQTEIDVPAAQLNSTVTAIFK